LAREAIEAGHKIIPIPGPSAALAGLVASGLPTDRFFFAGFLPAREAARRAEIEALADIDATLVFFESANRTPETLRDLAATFGARQAAVARELTKMFEQTVRGQLDELAARYAREGPPKGEVVIVLGPPLPKPELSDDELDAYLGPRLAGGVKEAASAAARDLGVPRKRAYARALALGQRR
jgi:16S rRNA (cytidine1402-2'-O)-methyltransferase